MSYKALYRTYRPSTFSQVAGQQHIVKTLSNALKENKIAHAYLFCGPRGTGKTSMARLFAKSLNCESGFGDQCNICPNCLAVMEGSHPDIIEIDAASNRGIDDIRDLISKVKYSPTLGKYKIYIIDEVHMMTTEAFNALLKTLEEPPSNVVFILCTTEPYKLMPTILSRVQRYDFNKVSNKDLLGNLQMIVDKEGISADEEALKLIVSLADGGVRDSLSMLDQAIAYSGSTLELHHIEELYGLTTLEEKVKLINALNDSDVKYFSTKLETLINHGTDIKRLTQDLIDIVKDMLVFKNTKDYSILKVITRDVADSISISKKTLIFMLDTLVETYSQYRFVSNLASLLEVCFLKISSLTSNEIEEEVAVKKIIKEVIVEEVKEVVPEPKPEVKPEVKEQPLPKKEEIKIDSKGIKELTDDGTPYLLSEEDTINLMQQGDKLEKQRIIDCWTKLDNLVTTGNLGAYVSLLKSNCSPRIVSKNVLVLEAQFGHIAKKISFKENQDGLVKVIETITDKKFTIVVLTGAEYIDRVQKFFNLRNAGKLPEVYPVDITIN